MEVNKSNQPELIDSEQEKIVEAVKSVKTVFDDIMNNERMGIKNSIPKEHLTLVSSIVEELMFELEKYLTEITGMDATTLQPAAGAHGELTGMLLFYAYHNSKGTPR